MAENHKLWGGRFEASLEKWVEEFGASISFDQKMAEFDLKGSIAHVTMLITSNDLSGHNNSNEKKLDIFCLA